METTRLSTKGQVILPKRIRDSRSWGPGVEFVVEETAEGVLLRPRKALRPASVEEVAGCLHYAVKGKGMTELDTKKAIEQQVRRRHGSGRY